MKRVDDSSADLWALARRNARRYSAETVVVCALHGAVVFAYTLTAHTIAPRGALAIVALFAAGMVAVRAVTVYSLRVGGWIARRLCP